MGDHQGRLTKLEDQKTAKLPWRVSSQMALKGRVTNNDHPKGGVDVEWPICEIHLPIECGEACDFGYDYAAHRCRPKTAKLPEHMEWKRPRPEPYSIVRTRKRSVSVFADHVCGSFPRGRIFVPAP